MKKMKILGFLTSIALPVSALISCGKEKEAVTPGATDTGGNPSSDAADDDKAQEGDGIEDNSNLNSIISDQIFEQLKKSNKNNLANSVQKPDDFILDIPQDDNQNQSVNITIKEWTANNEKGEIKWKVEIQKDQSSKEVYGHLTGYMTQDQHDMKVELEEFNAEQMINNKIKTQHIDLEKLPSQQSRPNGSDFIEVTNQGMQALIKDWQVIDDEGKIIYTVIINNNKFSKEFILQIDGMQTTAQEQQIKDAAKNITTSDIQGMIQANPDNIPSDVIGNFTNLSLTNNPHQLELEVDYNAHDQSGFVTWKININEKTKNNIKGKTIHSIYGVTSGFLSSIEKELKLVDINEIQNIPTANAQVLPSAVEMPTELQYTNYNQISANIANWSANDSLGIIDYEIELKKQQYTRIVSGQITGYQSSQGNQGNQNDQILIDYVSIDNHTIMELINNDFLLKPSEISQPNNFTQEITTDQGITGIVNVQILEWNQHDDHGDIHYKLNIQKGDIHKHSYGHVSGFLTTDQKELKDKFDQIQIGDIQNMPTLEPGTLASNQKAPLPSDLEINNIDKNNFEIIIQKWDANDALGTIDYEIKVSHNGLFEKIISGQITDIITSNEVVNIYSDLQSITFNDIVGIPESNPSILASDVTEPTISLAKLADKYDIEILEFNNSDSSDKGIINVSVLVKHKLYNQYEKNMEIIVHMFMTTAENQIKQKIDSMTLDDLEIINSISSDFDTFADQSILPGSVEIPEIQTVEVSDIDQIDVKWKLWNPIYSQGIIKVEVEVKQDRFTKVLTKNLGPFKNEQDIQDQILIDSIKPETFINFPAADDSFFPSAIFQPATSQLIEGVDIVITKWESNDYTGKINWEIQITKGNVVKNFSGTIEGYSFKPWSWEEQVASGNAPTEIPNYAIHIKDIKNLTFTEDLVIPDSVTYIDHYGFQNSNFENGSTLIIGNGLEVIGFTVFWGAKFNNGLDLSNTNIWKLGGYAFKSAHFQGSDFKLPDSLREITDHTFSNANIQSNFTLGNITTENFSIGFNAFENAKLPAGFQLPNVSSLSISANAFKSTEFKSGFTIPLNLEQNEIFSAFDAEPVNGYWANPDTNMKLDWVVPGAVFQENNPQ